ncbi:UDP-glucose flavonoid 3-O-glucosyltransferase 6, partial [Mucuna pruriens]
MKKAGRLVFIPSPGEGHLLPTIEFAKLVINRDDRLWISVLVMKSPYDTASVAYTQSLASEHLQVINLPECTSNTVQNSMTTLIEQQKPHVKEAVSNLPSSPPLAAFVVDMFCTAMIDVAKDFEVPSFVFFTSGLTFLGLVLHLHSLREQDNVHFRDSDTELAIPCFANPIPSTALPALVLEKEWDSLFLAYGRGLKKANGIIVNSFQELESHAVQSFSHGALPIYPVGPLINPKPKAHADDILNWLDHQPPSSVVFLCFGSMGSFGEDQVREIAIALENNGSRFLWSLRKPPPNSSYFRTLPTDYSISDLVALLPPGFLDRTAGIGKVIGWAPQAQILAHPATGSFVSHCGWNSTLESIYFGVPIATWPLYAEQQSNAYLLVRELKMAVEIVLDYRLNFKVGPNSLLSADKIEKGIRSLLDMDQDMRKRVHEMSQMSRETSLEGGSSYSNLGRLCRLTSVACGAALLNACAIPPDLYVDKSNDTWSVGRSTTPQASIVHLGWSLDSRPVGRSTTPHAQGHTDDPSIVMIDKNNRGLPYCSRIHNNMKLSLNGASVPTISDCTCNNFNNFQSKSTTVAMSPLDLNPIKTSLDGMRLGNIVVRPLSCQRWQNNSEVMD